ncbi:MAG: hypothetical protein ABIT76_06395 [Chthoniobacterales bacterium]
MKKPTKLLLVFAALVLAIFLFLTSQKAQLNKSPSKETALTSKSSPILSTSQDSLATAKPETKKVPVVAATQTSSTPASVLTPKQMAQIDLDKVRHMITDYHTLMGENPVGTNSEIMAALNGGNPRQARLGPPEGSELNKNGELVDRWGTPYFFHQLSKDTMEVLSAGADKIMWNDDDEMVR